MIDGVGGGPSVLGVEQFPFSIMILLSYRHNISLRDFKIINDY